MPQHAEPSPAQDQARVLIVNGDALAVLRTLESESVQVCVTSPPYFQLRRYLDPSDPTSALEMGSEQTPQAFLAALWAVFDEVKRVLRPDGLCFVNIGDSYAGSGKGPTGQNGIGDQEQRQGFVGVSDKSTLRNGKAYANDMMRKPILGGGVGVDGLPAKNLLLIPQRFAIGMQERGWIVRSQVVWAKKAPMPESVADRPTSAWEPIFMFAKSQRYFYDADAVRQPHADPGRGIAHRESGNPHNGRLDDPTKKQQVAWVPAVREYNPMGASLRNVWLLGPEPSREQHYAAFPTEIPRRCILAGTSQVGGCPSCGAGWRRVVEAPTGGSIGMGDWTDKSRQGITGQVKSGTAARRASANGTYRRGATLGWEPGCACVDAGPPVPQTVLDPFAGSGTTLLVADRLGRSAIGIELNAEYAEMARRRIANDAPMLTKHAVTVEAQMRMELMGEVS